MKTSSLLISVILLLGNVAFGQSEWDAGQRSVLYDFGYPNIRQTEHEKDNYDIPNEAVDWNKQGVDAAGNGRYNDAIVCFSNAISLSAADYASAYYNRGRAEYSLNMLKKAIADFDKAIAGPDKSQYMYHYYCGNAKYDMGDYKGAAKEFDKAIKIAPNFSLNYLKLGITENALKNYPGAIAYLTKCIGLAPQNASAYFYRSVAEKNAGYNKAADADMAKAKELGEPDETDISTANALNYFKKGTYLAQTDNIAEAIKCFDNTIKLYPTYAVAYNSRGFAKFSLGDLQGAEADLSLSISLDTNKGETYFNRANVRFERGDYDGVIIDLTSALRFKPSNARYHYNRGYVYKLLHQNKEAIADFTEALNAEPGYAAAYLNRGDVNYDMDNSPAACNDWDMARQLGNREGLNKLYKFCKWYNKP